MRTLLKGSGQLSCEIGMLAFWLSKFLEISGNCPNDNPTTYENYFLQDQDLQK